MCIKSSLVWKTKYEAVEALSIFYNIFCMTKILVSLNVPQKNFYEWHWKELCVTLTFTLWVDCWVRTTLFKACVYIYTQACHSLLSLGMQSNFKGDIFMTGNAALCSPVNLTILQAQGATTQYSKTTNVTYRQWTRALRLLILLFAWQMCFCLLRFFHHHPARWIHQLTVHPGLFHPGLLPANLAASILHQGRLGPRPENSAY